VADFAYRGLGWCEIALSGTLWFWAYVFYYSSFILAWLIATYRWRMIGCAIVGQDLRQMRQLQGEIAERKSAEARLQYMTLFDAFTGPPNLKLLFDRMTQIISTAKRDKTICALLLVDLQGKQINIAFGRETSGILLIHTAARLEKYALDSDMAVRIGEDAFVVMMTRLRNGDELQTVAGRICAALLKPYVVNDKEFHMDVAIGTGIYPSAGESVDELLKKAIKDKQPIKTVLFQADPAESGLSELP
jgi:diguanylate cyclase (GGDEF)-like protein